MISSNEAANALHAYVQGPAATAGPAKARTKPSAPAQSPQADPVSLSPQAADMGRWLAQLRSLPEVRGERVAAVTQQIQQGQYPPSGQAVAGRMLSRWLVNP